MNPLIHHQDVRYACGQDLYCNLCIEWSKSNNGEVVTTYKSFIRFINNRLHNYINPIYNHAVHVCEYSALLINVYDSIYVSKWTTQVSCIVVVVAIYFKRYSFRPQNLWPLRAVSA